MRKKITDNFRNNLLLYKLALYLGAVGYGGMAVVRQIKNQYVRKNNIVDDKKFLSSLSLAQVLPGSTIISLVAYLSYLKAGLIGAILSTAFYVFPSFVLMNVLAWIYFNYGNLVYIKKAVGGLNILLISLLLVTFISMGRAIFKRQGKADFRSVTIAAICAGLYLFSGISVIYIILICGILGILLYHFTGFYNDAGNRIEIQKGKMFIRKKAWLIFLLSIFFFGSFIFYFSEPLWTIFSSFLKIGSLAFGGGVAAIPLIRNIVVNEQHWFTERQFWDGMAIGQITPGPVFISAAFYGYKVAGVVGAFIATVAIIIPSVILIIVFGKIHDRIKHLSIVRSLIRGFLAGFMGALAVLIINQSQTFLVDPKSIILMAVTLAILIISEKGLVPSVIVTIAYSLIF